MNKKNEINPVVSVRLMVFNNSDFIREALDSVLMQKLNVPFEIVIGDDFSTDGTLEILEEYQNKYPDIINLLKRSKGDNYHQKRKNGNHLVNFKDILENCKGKYIALLDGDDYWDDPLKLQKQIDFLETHSEYTICFHKVLELDEINGKPKRIFPNEDYNTVYTISDYIENNLTATCSLFFRKDAVFPLPSWFLLLPFADLAIVLIAMKNSNGKGMLLNECMGVYRLHSGGIHGSLHKNNKSLIKAYKQHVKFTELIANNLLIESQYQKNLAFKKLNTFKILRKLSWRENFLISYFKFGIFELIQKVKLKLLYK